MQRALSAGVFLSLSLLPLSPAGAEEGGGGPPPPPVRVARERLPVLGTVGDLPPEGERVVVELTPQPALSAGGVFLDLGALRRLLQERSRGLRDEEPPAASRLHVVIRADRDVHWQDAQWVLQTCADPSVRVHRILFAAVPEDGGEEGAIATFLPVDSGIEAGEDDGPPVLPVRLRGDATSPADPGPTVYARMPRRRTVEWDEPPIALLSADRTVSTGAVLQTVDALLRGGVGGIAFGGSPLDSTTRLGDPTGAPVARPRVEMRGTPAAPPGPGDARLPAIARVTGRLAGITAGMARSLPPFGAGDAFGGRRDSGGVFGGRRGGRAALLKAEGGAGTEEAVEAALRWLQVHRSPEGHWDADGFEKFCSLGRCGGPGGPLYDPGVTGLSLLAFLGTGETHKTPKYGAVVRGGLKYLKGIQDGEGCFGPRTSAHFVYNHAMATLAMVEAYGITQSPLFKASAQAAVGFIGQCQNPYLAWRYGIRPGDNDTSITGWMVTALRMAERSGLSVEPASFAGARAWLDKVTEPEYGRTGYTARGNGPARPQEMMDRFPADRSESMTAIGIWTRILCGAEGDDAMVRKGADLCAAALPKWDAAAGTIDFYYWHFGTMAMFQRGGAGWRKWNEALRKALLGRQHRDAADDRCGSWDPVDPWAADGGRIYATAVNALDLEVYYRYARTGFAK